MTASVIDGFRIAGIVSCLPAAQRTSQDLARQFGPDAAAKIAKATGISAMHVCPPSQCTSDLAVSAASALLEKLDWSPDSIDLAIFVSQTHDHILPASACLLHERLGLSKSCAVFDQGLGCSGYVYGLWTALCLLASINGGFGRALLLAGDTTARLCAPDDRTVTPLFGDAAAATAVEADHGRIRRMTFNLGTDGAGAPYLTVPGGAMRDPGRPPRLFMDGTQVFAFTLREIPANIAATLRQADQTPADIDYFVLHQANAQMIRHLGQKIGARPDQIVLALDSFGNTSSASIPLAMTTGLARQLPERPLKLLLSGFGVGWSWGSVSLSTAPPVTCETLLLGEDGAVSRYP